MVMTTSTFHSSEHPIMENILRWIILFMYKTVFRLTFLLELCLESSKMRPMSEKFPRHCMEHTLMKTCPIANASILKKLLCLSYIVIASLSQSTITSLLTILWSEWTNKLICLILLPLYQKIQERNFLYIHIKFPHF